METPTALEKGPGRNGETAELQIADYTDPRPVANPELLTADQRLVAFDCHEVDPLTSSEAIQNG